MPHYNIHIQKIINVANDLATHGMTGGSTGEVIAAAFVLNRMEFLPRGYEDVLDAWDRLEPDWQHYVRQVKNEYQYQCQLVPWQAASGEPSGSPLNRHSFMRESQPPRCGYGG